MKSAREWIGEEFPIAADEDLSKLIPFVEAIQKDAFDAGRAKEMLIIAEMVEEQLPKTARSLRAYASDLTQPKDTPCSKNTP